MATLGSFIFDECHDALRVRVNRPVIEQNPGNGNIGAGILLSRSDAQPMPYAGAFPNDSIAVQLQQLRGTVVTASDDHGTSGSYLVEEITLSPPPRKCIENGVSLWWVSCIATLRAV